jgi:outer membrane protein insertion porin family
MINNLKFLTGFTFLFSLFCSFNLFGQFLQYENQKIEKIEVIVQGPCEGFDENIILSRIKTRRGDFFSQSDFDNDLKTLAQDYDRIEPLFNLADDKMFITLKIWPKPIIRTITWCGNERIKTKHLLEELKIPCFSVFDRRGFNQAFHKLKAYYVKKGYFEAELSYDVNLDPITNEVDICINIKEGRAGLIKDIQFVNFSSCEEEDICEQMVTKKYNIFLSWLNNEGIYNEEAMQHDQFNIVNYLHNEGYADATVDIQVCEAQQENRIVIVITAYKGSNYYVGNMSIEGFTLFSEEEIRRQFTFCEGGIYSPEKIRNTVENITNLYGRRGYIDATVDYEPCLSECEDCIYNIKFTIEEGEQFRVGLIKVFGNCQTQTKVILHETLVIPGEVFNIEKLKRTEERLTNVGYFSHVNVYAVKSEGPSSLGDNYRDVHIEVEETSTGHFGAFFGYSTNESIFGGLNVTEKNFNYKGLGCFLQDGYSALRGGGEYAHATATVGSKSRSYVFSWTKPYFNDTPWIVGFDLENSVNRYIAKDYDIKTFGGTLNAIYQLNQFMKIGWHYRLKHTDIETSGGLVYEELYDYFVKDESGASLVQESRNDGMVSAIGATWTYDSTDHPAKPTRGIKSRLEFEVAGFGGNYRFLGTAYTNSLYFKLDRRSVMKIRADVRFLYPFGGTTAKKMPLDERLFLGGDNMIRGYRPYKLGPRFIEGDPRGGMSMQIYSIEINRRLMKNLEGFVFLDAGHLSFATFDFGIEDAHISTSVGLGVNFKIFESMPPLTMGYGFPLNPKSRGEVKRFFISVGGRF